MNKKSKTARRQSGQSRLPSIQKLSQLRKKRNLAELTIPELDLMQRQNLTDRLGLIKRVLGKFDTSRYMLIIRCDFCLLWNPKWAIKHKVFWDPKTKSCGAFKLCRSCRQLTGKLNLSLRRETANEVEK